MVQLATLIRTPAGASTRNDARPVLGNVPIGGAGIYSCSTPGEVALTFDDGPYIYTDHILDLLAAAGAKATFFITGNNLGKGAIDTNWASVISRMDTDRTPSRQSYLVPSGSEQHHSVLRCTTKWLRTRWPSATSSESIPPTCAHRTRIAVEPAKTFMSDLVTTSSTLTSTLTVQSLLLCLHKRVH